MSGARGVSIEWTEQASLDLLDVLSFLHGERPTAALRFLSLLEQRLGQIALFPQSGRPVPEDTTQAGEDSPRNREVLVMKWRVGYRVGARPRDPVQVLYVIHGARQLPEDRLNRR